MGTGNTDASPTPDQRRITAYHEAAHAVVASQLGIMPERLDLHPAKSKWGVAEGHMVQGEYRTRQFREFGRTGVFYTPSEDERQREYLFKTTCVLYAGPIKEAWMTGQCLGGGGDYPEIEEILQTLGLTGSAAEQWVERAQRRAGGILWRRHDAIERLATALLESGKLDAEQIRRTLRKPRGKAALARWTLRAAEKDKEQADGR